MPSHPFEARLASLPPEAEVRLAAIIDFVCRDGHAAIDYFGGIDQFVAWERQMYDQYVAPIDVPWVPDVLEPVAIDMPAKQLIEALTRRVYQRGAPLLPAVVPVTQGAAP